SAYGSPATGTLPSGLTWAIDGSADGWTLVGNSLTYGPATLAAGGSAAVTVKATTAPANCGTLSNSVSGSATNEGSGVLANNSAGPITITVNCPDMKITKTANPAGPVYPGQQIGFDILITNNGAGTAYGVKITDTLPAGMT